ncbi:hypothetical protein F4803DRAFT_514485 [Xylaria telfairii]|nr:hypothetical protein F4803DRAFT_514485 [Xylaria telfairii]
MFWTAFAYAVATGSGNAYAYAYAYACASRTAYQCIVQDGRVCRIVSGMSTTVPTTYVLTCMCLYGQWRQQLRSHLTP